MCVEKNTTNELCVCGKKLRYTFFVGYFRVRSNKRLFNSNETIHLPCVSMVHSKKYWTD